MLGYHNTTDLVKGGSPRRLAMFLIWEMKALIELIIYSSPQCLRFECMWQKVTKSLHLASKVHILWNDVYFESVFLYKLDSWEIQYY